MGGIPVHIHTTSLGGLTNLADAPTDENENKLNEKLIHTLARYWRLLILVYYCIRLPTFTVVK